MPAWLNAWLRPCWRGKPVLPTMPSVSEVSAGTTRVPPHAARPWASSTAVKLRAGSSRTVPARMAVQARPSSSRGRPVRSASSPAGVLSARVAKPTIVVTRPMRAGVQCPAWASQVERNGPSPPWMSPTKRLMAARWAEGDIGMPAVELDGT